LEKHFKTEKDIFYPNENLQSMNIISMLLFFVKDMMKESPCNDQPFKIVMSVVKIKKKLHEESPHLFINL